MDYTTMAITIAAILALSVVFVVGYRIGSRNGYRRGKADTRRNLLLMKDPEAWNFSRTLEIDDGVTPNA